MKEKNAKRNRIIGLRLSLDEYNSLEKKRRTSNCRKLSDYARKKLFDKEIVRSVRNESLDDFMQEMMALRKALDASSASFSQSVTKLLLPGQKGDAATWLRIHELEKQTLLARVDEIKKKINKIADQWLQ